MILNCIIFLSLCLLLCFISPDSAVITVSMLFFLFIVLTNFMYVYMEDSPNFDAHGQRKLAWKLRKKFDLFLWHSGRRDSQTRLLRVCVGCVRDNSRLSPVNCIFCVSSLLTYYYVFVLFPLYSGLFLFSLQNEYMKDNFLIKIETWHKPDMGHLENVISKISNCNELSMRTSVCMSVCVLYTSVFRIYNIKACVTSFYISLSVLSTACYVVPTFPTASVC